jgi:UDP-N-acetylglucosamine 2-epimerase (non-hydrolysing)
MLIHLIAAARPNFMKIAPLYHALKKEEWADPVIVHTGQHYDLNMSDAFFRDLNLPEPHIHLGVGSGSHAEQTGKVMIAYEKVLVETRPDLVVAVGDVNSTMAATLAATKIIYPRISRYPASSIQYPASLPRGMQSASLFHWGSIGSRPLVAHLEAGLRSFDRTMPEEINRLVTDALADILWTPSPDADENLQREGVSPAKIKRVGNIMIDSLEMLRGSIEKQTTYEEINLEPGEYGVVTLHRPSNVDNSDILSRLCQSLAAIAHEVSLVFPIHPRTRKNLDRFGLLSSLSNCNGLRLLEPLNYVRFMNLVFNCRLAITDSGGIQEETTYLGIPCLTLRPNTERPITVREGTNRLCSIDNLEECASKMLKDKKPIRKIPESWDGRTASRVVASIRESVNGL